MVRTAQRGFTFTRLASCLFFGSECALMAFAEPRVLAQLLSDNSSTIPVLDKPGAVANALLLAGHPFLLRLPT